SMLYAYSGVCMAKSLLVVESPTKMKTLSKFLGSNFIIKATYGHIKDLPKSRIGVDIEKDFTPHFLVLKGKGKAVDEIKKASKNVDKIYIGSDPDREGEAIAFHVAEVIGSKKEIERVLFHEITKKGVLDALKNPTILDDAKYNAQKARRILDRLVGYKISPILWEKVSYGLSAGRVQSVALRIVCDREEEIEAFVKEEYWIIDGEFKLASGKKFKAILERKNDVKLKISTQNDAEKIKKEIQGLGSYISKIEIKDKNVFPQPGFITSRLQQEASRKFKFSPKKTMLLAQKLYEGVDIGGEEGVTGLITYMRTDSVRVSDEAIKDARQYVNETYGKAYLPKTPNYFKNKKTAQDAHEAIRPAYAHLTPEKS
ncbi:MAG: type I DNA topoisomerase, partial [Deltaproteobacteria bacterium]